MSEQPISLIRTAQIDVTDVTTALVDLDMRYGTELLVDALAVYLGDAEWCSCADEPALCVSCLVRRRLALPTVPEQLTAVTR